MQRKDAKSIIMYYRAIPEMKKLLKQERRELEEEYFGLRGISMDGVPGGSMPGKPVENAAIMLEDSGASDRLQDIEKRVQKLEADALLVQGVLDTINGRYKSVLIMRYINGYSWGKISVRMGTPDSTIRHWNEKALFKFGKALEDAKAPCAILGRASHARV